jgi:hypothetical protein
MEFKINLETEPYCCEHELISDILNTLEYINKNKSGGYSSVAVLGYDDIIERLFKTICSINFEDSNAELVFDKLDYDFTDYENEYALILSLEDCYTREFTVSIEKALHKDGSYNLYELDYLYIDEACDEELVKKHLQFEDTMDIFSITGDCEEEFDEEEFECDGDCENCDLNNDDEIEEDEEVSLYELVESMVESILENKFTRK